MSAHKDHPRKSRPYFAKGHAHQSAKDYDRKMESKAILDELRTGGTLEAFGYVAQLGLRNGRASRAGAYMGEDTGEAGVRKEYTGQTDIPNRSHEEER